MNHDWISEMAGDILGWMQQADCGDIPDPDIFFPDDEYDSPEEMREKERVAKAICSKCPVQEACLAYALRLNIKYGIFAGLTAKERQRAAN